ncbi:MAG: saccharopine dehydrogenase C-terminal domain-containing protein [bacterium]
MAHKTVLLLGLGMQGTAALHDLVQFEMIDRIQVVDIRPDLAEVLAPYPDNRVAALDLDLADTAAVERAMAAVDLVVEVLPASLAVSMGQAAATVGVPLVSSVFYVTPRESDPARIQLLQATADRIDHLARERGVPILTEFGLDPGIDVVLGARACAELDEVLEFRSYGAGIPDPGAADNPLRYKFSWAPLGVMQAYVRPASVITGGRPKRIAGHDIFAPENLHELNLPELGTTLECYPNGNAVSYARQFGLNGNLHEAGRFTCRLPGHCDFWRVVARSGFLDDQPIQVGDSTVSPVQFTAALLQAQEQFRYGEGEQDIAMVRLDVRGLKDGREQRLVYQLVDRRDLDTGLTAMQRTVGFMLGLGARLILSGRVLRSGLLTALDVQFEDVIAGLVRHGMRVTREVS